LHEQDFGRAFPEGFYSRNRQRINTDTSVAAECLEKIRATFFNCVVLGYDVIAIHVDCQHVHYHNFVFSSIIDVTHSDLLLLSERTLHIGRNDQQLER